MRPHRLLPILALSLAAFSLGRTAPASADPPRALFDNTHAETAGNADWQIDTDQPLPSPDQSTVTWSTPRTYWLGAVSSWAIDLVKRGYEVATLTPAYGISYGDAQNPYDLSNYDVFIVPEPNTVFTAAESTAIFDYVRDGGGLVAVCDHSGSDRNNDGADSPKIWGRLDRQHLWGAHFDSTGEANNNITQDSDNVDTDPQNPVVNGVNGLADILSFHNGTTMTLHPATNPSVTGDVWMNGLSHGNAGVMAAHAAYGNGRIVFIGDSSPIDDGSAAPGNSSIYDGWAEASGRDSLLAMNGTMWATRTAPAVSGVPAGFLPGPVLAAPFPNPSRGPVAVSFSLPAGGAARVRVVDVEGRRVWEGAVTALPEAPITVTWNGRDAEDRPAPAGIYFVRVTGGGGSRSARIVRLP